MIYHLTLKRSVVLLKRAHCMHRLTVWVQIVLCFSDTQLESKQGQDSSWLARQKSRQYRTGIVQKAQEVMCHYCYLRVHDMSSGTSLCAPVGLGDVHKWEWFTSTSGTGSCVQMGLVHVHKWGWVMCKNGTGSSAQVRGANNILSMSPLNNFAGCVVVLLLSFCFH